MSQTILLTGGAGYIGSHTAVELLEANHSVVIVDNLSNSSAASVDRVRALVPGSSLEFVKADVLDAAALDKIFTTYDIDAVIHFAALKAVGESVAEPLRYYENNVGGSVSLLKAMQRHNVRRFVFSSSATVYGDPATVPIDESAPLHPTNPYGWSKMMVEQATCDVARSEHGWHVSLLRYFNPVGAHMSGMIGEDPNGIPDNLMPYMMQVATGRHPKIRVFGNDYPTPDGTGVRDYIHVVDLAIGHLAALRALDETDGVRAINLGTGRGHSVLEVIASAAKAVGNELPYEITERRPGDIAACWADPSLAAEILGWKATRTLDDMCADSWRWQSMNFKRLPLVSKTRPQKPI